MNFVLLLPLGLAALAAWLLPLLIHLRRRNEQHRTDFAALRWLGARARPRSRLRFEEWPLLLVRLVLLAALALLFSHPVLFGGPHAERWIVVAPGVERASIPEDSEGTERRWLAPGFPSLDEAMPQRRQPVGSLLRELDASLPGDTRVTVLVPSSLDGADAARPGLHRAIDWRIVEGTKETTKPGSSPTPRPSLSVRYVDARRDQVRYLRAAAMAWHAATSMRTDEASTTAAGDIGGPAIPLPSTDKPLVWLAAGALPASLLEWVEHGGTALVDKEADLPAMVRDGIPVWRDDDGEVLVRGMPHGRGRLLQLTKPLTPEAMPILLDAAFPDRLWALFAPKPVTPSRIAANEYAPRSGGHAWPEQPRDLQSWLLLLIAGLFVIERWMATGRREVGAP
jgi:hypothetical protein